MAARLKALLGGRAKDGAFLQVPSGGQKTKHGNKDVQKYYETNIHVLFQAKTSRQSYRAAIAMTGI